MGPARAELGWEGLKCQAKGLGLNFSGTREPLMVSEPASDLIKHKFSKCLAVSVLEGWAWGDIYVASRLSVPLLQLRVSASQECVNGTQAKQSHWGLTLCSPSPKAGTAWGSPAPLGSLAPSTRDTLGNQRQPGCKSHSAPPLCKCHHLS